MPRARRTGARPRARRSPPACLGLVVEHHEHGTSRRGRVLAIRASTSLWSEEVVADVLHRLELAVRQLLRHEHARVGALERVEVVDVEEVAQPAIDAEQVERGRRDEVDRRLVGAEERADLGDAAQGPGRLGHGAILSRPHARVQSFTIRGAPRRLARVTVVLRAGSREGARGVRREEQWMAAVQPGMPAVSLREKLFRRKPVGVMADETGADTGGGELKRTIGLFQLTLFGVGATIGTGIFIDPHRGGADRRARGDPVVRDGRHGGRADGHLLRRAGGRRAGLGLVLLVRVRDLGRGRGDGRRRLPAARVRRVGGRASPSAGRSTSTSCSTTCSGSRSRTPSRRRPSRAACSTSPRCADRAVHAAAAPRRESESARVNAIMVMIKLGVLALFVIARPARAGTRTTCRDFAPDGFSGITSAAGIIFFSYIGLDAVSTAGEEVKNPRRNLPLAIIFALLIVTGDLHRGRRSSRSRRSPLRSSRARRPGCRRSSRTSPGRPGRRRSWPPARWSRSSASRWWSSTARRASCSRWAATG